LSHVKTITLNDLPLSLAHVSAFAFRTTPIAITVAETCRARIERSRRYLLALLDKDVPIYGVTTGFGDSCARFVAPNDAADLQRNLLAYLRCGVGPRLSRPAVRAMMLVRLNSLCRGYSGVSWELVDRLRIYLERDWLPVVPSQGSLGASGDLIPLAYLGAVLAGDGDLETPEGIRPAMQVLQAAGMEPLQLGAKEGLAIVNGTSTMAGQCVVNLAESHRALSLAATLTAWTCLALGGRTEPFDALVNEKASKHPGQAQIARHVAHRLREEGYRPKALESIAVTRDGGMAMTVQLVQDRYSLRCTPQVLGPVLETLTTAERWLEEELNGASDNPLLDEDGGLAVGGNFYGGYLAHAMDYTKISLGHIVDLLDRQFMLVVDDKTNRGLPPNLANWPALPPEERHLHHGLKGFHQAANAITAEVLSQTMPNSVFSRSSESHNQDKVSLGMTAAMQCTRLLDGTFSVLALVAGGLAQALDLRGITLRGERSRELYAAVRRFVPATVRDTALGAGVESMSLELRNVLDRTEDLAHADS